MIECHGTRQHRLPFRYVNILCIILAGVLACGGALFALRNTEVSTSGASQAHQHFGESTFTPNDEALPQPWGYHKERNIPRLRAIIHELDSSIYHPSLNPNGTLYTPFTIVDFGSDQGYFALNLARRYGPAATVLSVDQGGVGGEIWKSQRHRRRRGARTTHSKLGESIQEGEDVLAYQRRRARLWNLSNIFFCRATITPAHFTHFRTLPKHPPFIVTPIKHPSNPLVVLLLSVFHWLPLETRESFEEAAAAVWTGAAITFIELPIVGVEKDIDSFPAKVISSAKPPTAILRRQVGAQRVMRWYDGRSSVDDVLREAAQARKIDVSVREIASVKWLQWSRKVYRIDSIRRQVDTNWPKGGFDLESYREVLRCKFESE